MDFKLQELLDSFTKKEGWKPILITFGLNMVLTFIMIGLLMLFLGASIFLPLINGNEPDFESLFNPITIILGFLVILFSTIVGMLIQAGLLGSLKNVVLEGKPGSFFSSIKDNWIRVILMGLFYTFLIFFLMIVIIFPIAFVLGYLEAPEFIMNMVVSFIVTILTIFIIPMFYLSVFKGSPFSNYFRFIKDNFTLLLVISLVSAILMSIPLINIFGQMLMNIVYLALPLYTMIIYKDNTLEKKESFLDK